MGFGVKRSFKFRGKGLPSRVEGSGLRFRSLEFI